MDDGGDCSISTAAGGTALSPCASGAAPCELGCPGDGFAVKAAGSSGDPDQQEAALHPVVCTSEEAMLMAETIPESFIRVPSKMSAVPDSEEITDDICPSSPPHHISHPQGDIGEGQHGNSISPVHHEGGEKAPLTMSAAAAGQAGFKGHGAAGDSSTRRADSCAVLSSPPKREPMEAGNKPRPLSCRRLSALPATLPQQINSGPAEGPGQQPTAVAEVSEREPQGDFCHDERNSGAPVAGPSRLVESPTGCPAPSRQRRPAGDVAPGMKLTKTEIDATANETREFFDVGRSHPLSAKWGTSFILTLMGTCRSCRRS